MLHRRAGSRIRGAVGCLTDNASLFSAVETTLLSMRPTALAATSARRFLAIFSLVVLVPSATNGFDLFIDADYGLNVLKWRKRLFGFRARFYK